MDEVMLLADRSGNFTYDQLIHALDVLTNLFVVDGRETAGFNQLGQIGSMYTFTGMFTPFLTGALTLLGVFIAIRLARKIFKKFSR